MSRVSVIMPTFNCATFIGRALDSVTAQTYKDLEIVVVDDGSTDNTHEVVSLRPQGNIQYVFQSNRGLSAARNAGISRASGEFIAYLDADDMWYPDKLRRQVEFLDKNPACGLVHSDLSIVDENDAMIHHDWYRETRQKPLSGFCLLEILGHCRMQVPSVMERRFCYEQTGGFDERLKRVEDYLHWTQILLAGHAIGYIDEPLAMYRWRNNSLSRNYISMVESTIQVFQILIQENGLYERAGRGAGKIVAEHIRSLRQGLTFYYRQQGQTALARHNAMMLIQCAPLRFDSYRQFLLSCMPTALYGALRKLQSPLFSREAKRVFSP